MGNVRGRTQVSKVVPQRHAVRCRLRIKRCGAHVDPPRRILTGGLRLNAARV
jgi:hypothetical protein